MNVKLKVKKTSLYVSLVGELDQHNSYELKLRIAEILSKYKIMSIIFDMKELDFMDSSGIGLILGRYNQLKKKNGEIVLCNLNENIRKIIMISGLYKICVIKEDELSANYYVGVA